MQVQRLIKDSIAFTLFPTTLDKGPSEGVKMLYLDLTLEYDVGILQWPLRPASGLFPHSEDYHNGRERSRDAPYFISTRFTYLYIVWTVRLRDRKAHV